MRWLIYGRLKHLGRLDLRQLQTLLLAPAAFLESKRHGPAQLRPPRARVRPARRASGQYSVQVYTVRVELVDYGVLQRVRFLVFVRVQSPRLRRRQPLPLKIDRGPRNPAPNLCPQRVLP